MVGHRRAPNVHHKPDFLSCYIYKNLNFSSKSGRLKIRLKNNKELYALKRNSEINFMHKSLSKKNFGNFYSKVENI